MSEIVGFILEKLGIDLNPDTASNLLAGIEFATRNFSLPETSADAFELTARCLKSGAKRQADSSSVISEKTSPKPRVKIPLQDLSKDARGLNQEETPPDD